MKKTNAKMIAILVAIIAVVVTFMAFEIPAFAEEMNTTEENIEMTVENEPEESKIEAEFDFTIENNFEFEVEEVEDNNASLICYIVEDEPTEEAVVETVVVEDTNDINEECEEIAEELVEEETIENKEIVEKADNQVIKVVEVEEKAEKPATKKTTNNEEKAVVNAQEQVKVEINENENKLYAEFENSTIVDIKSENENIEKDFAPVTDFTLTWIQDIDTFLVNEKRAIIA